MAGPNAVAAKGSGSAGVVPPPAPAIAVIPSLTIQQIAKLHGFESPEALVAWESDQRRREGDDFDWDEEDSIG